MVFNPSLNETAERKLELANTFNEYLSANIFVVDKTGKVIYSNQHSAETYQCSMDQLFRFNAFTMQEEGWIEREPAVLEVIRTGRSVRRYIKTGKNVGMIITCSPVFDENGELEYAVATSYAEQTFLDMFSTLDAEKSKLQTTLQYLTDVSHDSAMNNSHDTRVQGIYSLAERAARSDSVVMIYGESGTGKEVLAHFIHEKSRRSSAPFIPINCAAIPSDLMESEFFGYDKGSFTGADNRGKLGLFEMASDGTIFLDEIGELTLPMQSKLLRVLESGEFMHIGGSKVIKTNARIIGATNRDLFKLVQEGSFRNDLYYRLNIIPLCLPTLADRKNDIMPLAYTFLEQFNRKLGTSKNFSTSMCEFLTNYSWPGNIRELKNLIERMVVTTAGDVIHMTRDLEYLISTEGATDIHESAAVSGTALPDAASGDSTDYSLPYKEALHRFEKDYINHVIENCGGNVTEASKHLGLHRSSIYNILNRP